ncbi:MAG TPA: hypothetical protein VLB44_17565 [Kofleriaceae bacterium]|nr:hypothetical protein [Kofleriaceae bacterium]
MRTLFLVFVLSVLAVPARADTPWANGVPAEQQAKANALFAEGNQLFSERAHAPALEKYKAAIALWDHPMIRYNMAVTLIRLDRILDAADELEKALRFGATPFTKELYQQALDYQSLVRKQLADIEVTCDQPGTHIQLDGKPWFDGPGTKKMRVTAGEHSVIAERKGYLPESRRLVVAGGTTEKQKLKLVPLESAVIIEYKSPRWIPWTITATGGAIAAGGFALWLLGKNQMDDFAKQYTTDCPTGCESDLSMHPALASQQDGALFKGKVGVGMMIGGGAVTVTGVIWTVMNRPIRRMPRVEVAPSANGGMSARATWRF